MFVCQVTLALGEVSDTECCFQIGCGFSAWNTQLREFVRNFLGVTCGEDDFSQQRDGQFRSIFLIECLAKLDLRASDVAAFEECLAQQEAGFR